MTVVTRVAPSPTGDPHVGTAYVALFNWAWARRHGGRFILRIEDTDRTRSRPEHEAAILDALAWLGLEPDESPFGGGEHGPYRQSERGEVYREHVERLIASGHAYRCFCTPERLAELRSFQRAARRPTGYDRKCRSLPREESAQRAQDEAHVVRLAVDRAATTRFTDLLRGEIRIENENVDDQVLLKSDGMPTYHLANVVDDHLMGVTIIIRAEEWIPSVPKHVILYEAFGWKPPVFAHVPLLRNADKSKISKRKNPTSILWYRQQGYLPGALLNFLALLGWSLKEDDEQFDIETFVARFDPADIRVGGPVFDLTKLDWLNGARIRAMPVGDLADLLLAEGFAGGWQRERLLKVLPLFQERMRTLVEFVPAARYLDERVEPDMQGLAKKVKKSDPTALAEAMTEAASALRDRQGQPDEVREQAIRAVAERHGLRAGHLFMGLRVAVTGVTASPPLLPSVDLVGLDEVVARIHDVAGRLVPTT